MPHPRESVTDTELRIKQRNRGGNYVFHIALPSTLSPSRDDANGPKETYVTLAVGTVGEFIAGPDTLDHPGFVTIRVNGETLYTFARDLQENAVIEPLACDTA